MRGRSPKICAEGPSGPSLQLPRGDEEDPSVPQAPATACVVQLLSIEKRQVNQQGRYGSEVVYRQHPYTSAMRLSLID